MPPGAPYNSFILPYRIRIDHFTASASQDCAASLHLLTHTHSDHIGGLSAQTFGYKVICSRDAKEMLLRHEVYAERELLQLELRAEKTRTFSHLKVDPLRFPDGTMYYVGSRDLLVRGVLEKISQGLMSMYRKRFHCIHPPVLSSQTRNLSQSQLLKQITVLARSCRSNPALHPFHAQTVS